MPTHVSCMPTGPATETLTVGWHRAAGAPVAVKVTWGGVGIGGGGAVTLLGSQARTSTTTADVSARIRRISTPASEGVKRGRTKSHNGFIDPSFPCQGADRPGAYPLSNSFRDLPMPPLAQQGLHADINVTPMIDVL